MLSGQQTDKGIFLLLTKVWVDKIDNELTSFDGLVERNDGNASLTNHSDRNVR